MKMSPDPGQIFEFLDHLFGDALAGRVELAWTDAGDGKLRHARTFSLDDLETLVDEATKVNSVEDQNVYIGAALRKPDTPPFGRCKDEDFLPRPRSGVT